MMKSMKTVYSVMK